MHMHTHITNQLTYSKYGNAHKHAMCHTVAGTLNLFSGFEQALIINGLGDLIYRLG